MLGKKVRILLFILLVALSSVHAFAAAWADVVYDAEVPAKTRENVAKAIDTTADLLGKYKIVLPKDIKVVVTADLESYIQAYMFYSNATRLQAEEYCKNTGGVSLRAKPVVIVRGTPLFMNSREEVYRTVPHEIFHQVQFQYGRVGTAVAWLTEGTPEMFRFIAQEAAGYGKVEDYLRRTENIIRKAPGLPDAREFIDYKKFQALRNQQGYPVYEMSVLMTARLIQDNGFENVIFFYQLLHNGSAADKAFITAFRVPMSWFLTDMNAYFEKLRNGK